MKTTKAIAWSYPSSSNAEKFGRGKTGPPIAIDGFDTLEAAKAAGELLGHDWDKYTHPLRTFSSGGSRPECIFAKPRRLEQVKGEQ